MVIPLKESSATLGLHTLEEGAKYIHNVKGGVDGNNNGK